MCGIVSRSQRLRTTEMKSRGGNRLTANERDERGTRLVVSRISLTASSMVMGWRKASRLAQRSSRSIAGARSLLLVSAMATIQKWASSGLMIGSESRLVPVPIQVCGPRHGGEPIQAIVQVERRRLGPGPRHCADARSPTASRRGRDRSSAPWTREPAPPRRPGAWAPAAGSPPPRLRERTSCEVSPGSWNRCSVATPDVDAWSSRIDYRENGRMESAWLDVDGGSVRPGASAGRRFRRDVAPGVRSDLTPRDRSRIMIVPLAPIERTIGRSGSFSSSRVIERNDAVPARRLRAA